MTNNKIVDRYTRALFDLARERNSSDAVHRDLGEIRHLIRESKEFRDFLKNPVIPLNKQKSILEESFRQKVDPLTYTFLAFLAERKRLNLLALICDVFDNYYLRWRNILTVNLISAHPLDEDQAKAICRKINEHFGQEVHPQLQLEPRLLGGFKVQMGDLIYDYSLRSQLFNFRKSVMTS